MSHDHVGVPKFIENGFSNNGKVYCYNLLKDNWYPTSTDKLGTENNYYDEDVEKKLLADSIEYEFSRFYNVFCFTTDTNFMASFLNRNIKLVEQFFSFMVMRSKKTLEIVNDSSLSSELLGDLDHSGLVRLSLAIKPNPLTTIGAEYQFYPLINFSAKHFLNNSVGFCTIENNASMTAIFIPLTSRVGIYITNDDNFHNSDYLFIKPDRNDKVDFINKKICKTEKEMGNGFIFGKNKELVPPYIDYIKKI